MEDVTLGELARRMDSMHQDLRELRQVVVEHEDLTSVVEAWQGALAAQAKLHEEQLASVRQEVSVNTQKIDRLGGWVTWTGRVVIGAVIIAVIGLVILPAPI